MSEHEDSVSPGEFQSPAFAVSVELRHQAKPNSPIKAHADVTIQMGQFGSIEMFGFSLYHPDGKPPVVLPPARKGERRSFPFVKLKGRIREAVETAVLQEYLRTEA